MIDLAFAIQVVLDLGLANREKLAKNVDVCIPFFFFAMLFGRLALSTFLPQCGKWNCSKDTLKKTPHTFDLGFATWLRAQL